MSAARIGTVQELVRRHGADAALVTFLPDIRWSVGFSGSNGTLMVTSDRAYFATDGRYTEQAGTEVSDAEVAIVSGSLIEHLITSAELPDGATVLVQGDHMTLSQRETVVDAAPSLRLHSVSGLLSGHVASKTDGEISAIRQAQSVTEEVFDAILPFIGPGVREIDIAAEIVYQHLKRGASAMAFDPIVGSGPRGALPHGRPSGKTLRPGELIVIDMGCVYEGYCSDMTRTVSLGDPGDDARQAYSAVVEAQQAAVSAVRAGASGREIDAQARAVLSEAGLGDYFTHGLGHGIGMQVHEWPRLSHQVDHTLPENAAVTVEPGVYLPGRFGIRIEDIVVARAKGPDVLTRTPKDLLVL